MARKKKKRVDEEIIERHDTMIPKMQEDLHDLRLSSVEICKPWVYPANGKIYMKIVMKKKYVYNHLRKLGWKIIKWQRHPKGEVELFAKWPGPYKKGRKK